MDKEYFVYTSDAIKITDDYSIHLNDKFKVSFRDNSDPIMYSIHNNGLISLCHFPKALYQIVLTDMMANKRTNLNGLLNKSQGKEHEEIKYALADNPLPKLTCIIDNFLLDNIDIPRKNVSFKIFPKHTSTMYDNINDLANGRNHDLDFYETIIDYEDSDDNNYSLYGILNTNKDFKTPLHIMRVA